MADFTTKICHLVSLAKKQVFQRISFYRLVTWLKGENATASLSAAFTASSQRYSAMSDISRPAGERPVQTSLAPAASQQDPATASRTLAQSATDQQLPRKPSFYNIGDSTEVNETITAPQDDSFEELDMNEQDLAVEAYLDAAEVPTAPPASDRDDGSPVVPVGCKACAGQHVRHSRTGDCRLAPGAVQQVAHTVECRACTRGAHERHTRAFGCRLAPRPDPAVAAPPEPRGPRARPRIDLTADLKSPTTPNSASNFPNPYAAQNAAFAPLSKTGVISLEEKQSTPSSDTKKAQSVQTISAGTEPKLEDGVYFPQDVKALINIAVETRVKAAIKDLSAQLLTSAQEIDSRLDDNLAYIYANIQSIEEKVSREDTKLEDIQKHFRSSEKAIFTRLDDKKVKAAADYAAVDQYVTDTRDELLLQLETTEKKFDDRLQDLRLETFTVLDKIKIDLETVLQRLTGAPETAAFTPPQVPPSSLQEINADEITALRREQHEQTRLLSELKRDPVSKIELTNTKAALVALALDATKKSDNVQIIERWWHEELVPYCRVRCPRYAHLLSVAKEAGDDAHRKFLEFAHTEQREEIHAPGLDQLFEDATTRAFHDLLVVELKDKFPSEAVTYAKTRLRASKSGSFSLSDLYFGARKLYEPFKTQDYQKERDLIDQKRKPAKKEMIVAWIDDLEEMIDRLLEEEIIFKTDDFSAAHDNLVEAMKPYFRENEVLKDFFIKEIETCPRRERRTSLDFLRTRMKWFRSKAAFYVEGQIPCEKDQQAERSSGSNTGSDLHKAIKAWNAAHADDPCKACGKKLREHAKLPDGLLRFCPQNVKGASGSGAEQDVNATERGGSPKKEKNENGGGGKGGNRPNGSESVARKKISDMSEEEKKAIKEKCASRPCAHLVYLGKCELSDCWFDHTDAKVQNAKTTQCPDGSKCPRRKRTFQSGKLAGKCMCPMLHPKDVHNTEVALNPLDVDFTSTSPYRTCVPIFGAGDSAAHVHVVKDGDEADRVRTETIRTALATKNRSVIATDGVVKEAVLIPEAAKNLYSYPKAMEDDEIIGYTYLNDVPNELITRYPALYVRRGSRIVCIPLGTTNGMTDVPQDFDLARRSLTAEAASLIKEIKDVNHSALEISAEPAVRSFCGGCGSDGHETGKCTPLVNSVSVNAALPVPAGCSEWRFAPDATSRPITKHLRKLGLPTPYAFWCSSAAAPAPPKHEENVTAADVLLDSGGQVKMFTHNVPSGAPMRQISKMMAFRIYLDCRTPSKSRDTTKFCPASSLEGCGRTLLIDNVMIDRMQTQGDEIFWDTLIKEDQEKGRQEDASLVVNLAEIYEAEVDEGEVGIDDDQVLEISDKYRRRKTRIALKGKMRSMLDKMTDEHLKNADLDRIVADSMGHLGCRCELCLTVQDSHGKARRRHEAVDVAEVCLRTWHVDGVPIEPPSVDGERVAQVIYVESKDRIFCEPTEEHTDAATLDKLKYVAGLVEESPLTLHGDDGPETKGVVTEWVEAQKDESSGRTGRVAPAPPYTKYRNGTLESRWRTVKNVARTVVHRPSGKGRVPKKFWPQVNRWAAQSVNLFGGVYDESLQDKMLKKFCAFGTKVLVKHTPATRQAFDTYDAANFEACFLRFEENSDVIVYGTWTHALGKGWFLKEGRSIDVQILYGVWYDFGEADEKGDIVFGDEWRPLRKSDQQAHARDVKRRARDGRHWAQCDVIGCHKWRELRDGRDRQRVSKLKRVTCWDMGYSCAEPQDPDGLEDEEQPPPHEPRPLRRSPRLSKVNDADLTMTTTAPLAPVPEQASACREWSQIPYEFAAHVSIDDHETYVRVVDGKVVVDVEPLEFEVNVIEGVSRTKAYSSEPFFDTGKTFREVAEAAEQLERDGYDLLKAFGWDRAARGCDVRDRAKRTKARINFGILMIIYGIKNAEDAMRRKFKVRSVCAKEYDCVTGATDDGYFEGEQPVLDLPCPEGQKLGVVLGVGKRKQLVFIDLRNGYLTADSDGVEMWMRVPDSWIPPAVLRSFGYADVDEYTADKKARGLDAEIVVPTDKSVYGRKRAGFDFDGQCDAKFTKPAHGWKRMSDVAGTQDRIYLRDRRPHTDPSAVKTHPNVGGIEDFGPDHHTRHVDDITAAVADADKFIAEVKQEYPEITHEHLTADGPPVTLLGVKIWLKEIKIWRNVAGDYVLHAEGPTENCDIPDIISIVVFDQRDLCRRAVEEFKVALKEKTGRTLRPKATPVKPADHWRTEENKRRSLGERREYTSSCCNPWSSPEVPAWISAATTLRREYWLGTEFISELISPSDCEKPIEGALQFIFSEDDPPLREGIFSKVALHYVGEVGYLVEWTRSDLAYARTQVATDGKAWSEVSDDKLEWLFGYMMATVEYVQVAYISSYDLRERLLMIEAGSDASHAQYVSGHGHHAGYTRLTGPITNVPVKFKSKKATRVSPSSGADEVFGMCGVTKDVILVDALLRGYSGATGFEHLLVSDAQAALSLLRTPSISKSRLWGMRTTHHVDLGGLRDFWRSPGRRAQWRDGHLLAPDLGTKAVSKDTHTRLLPQLRVMPMSETSRSLP